MIKDELKKKMDQMDLKIPATEEQIATAEKELSCILPTQYKVLMQIANGAEGPIGKNGYLVLWPIDELKKSNIAYGVNEFAPGFLIFGSDGGDCAYAFDIRVKQMPVVEMPFIGMAPEEAIPLADNFFSFLDKLAAD